MILKDLISKSNGTSLYQHSIEVAEYAKELASVATDDKVLIELSWLCGFLHDIGKIFPNFQDYLKEESTDRESQRVNTLPFKSIFFHLPLYFSLTLADDGLSQAPSL